MPSSSPAPQPVLTKEHLYFCFDVLKAKLANEKVDSDLRLPDEEEE